MSGTTTETLPPPRRNVDVIDDLKGIAIVLVVAAHLVKYQTLHAADWYETFKFKVYLFHMPLFMFASGYVYFHTGTHRRPLRELVGYGLRRADRLLVPFIAIAALTVCAKLMFFRFSYVDEVPASFTQAWRSLVVDTESSPALTVWYLFVLFVFCMLTPLLYRLSGKNRIRLGLIAAALYPLSLPDVLFANRLPEFYIFFIAGGLAQSFRYLDRLPSALSSVLFGILFALSLSLPLERGTGLLLCGLLSAAAIPAMLRFFPRPMLDVLRFCGRRSMTIYLFNVMAIGVAKAAFLKVSPYDESMFIPLLLVTFSAGLLVPILIKWLSGLSPRTAIVHRYIS